MAVVPDQALVLVVRPVVLLALQQVLGIEEEKEAAARVPMPHGDMIIKKRKGIKKEKEKGREKKIGIRTETVRRKGKRGIMLSLIKLNKKHDRGINFVNSNLFLFIIN